MEYVQLYAQYQGDNLFPSIGATANFGNYIELDQYDSEPIKLTMSIQTIEDPTTTTSSFSRVFRVPNTSINGKFFKAAFNVNSIDFDATKKANAYINADGAFFISGNIRLNSVIVSPSTGKIEYEIGFFGDTSTFASVVGPKNLSELDLTAYAHPLTYANVINSWNPGGLYNGDIVYPLCEWGYTYGTTGPNAGQPQQSTLSVYTGTTGNAGSMKGFTYVNNPLALDQFKPSIRIKAVWDAIFAQAGFTYDSDFLDSSLFRNIYMMSTNSSSALMDSVISARVNLLQNQPILLTGYGYSANTLVKLGSIINDNSNGVNIPGSYYTTTYAGTYTFRYAVNVNFEPNYNFFLPYTVGFISYTLMGLDAAGNPVTPYATRSGLVPTFNPAVPFGGEPYYNGTVSDATGTTPGFVVLTATLPDNTRVALSFTSSTTYFGSLNITNGTMQVTGPVVVIPSGLMPTQYKQLEFIKAVNDRFKLMWIPSKTQANKFTIVPWVDWVKSGRQLDWTDKLDGNKDASIKPLFTTQPRKVVFSDSEESDIYNFSYQQQYKQTFGQLNQDSNIEIITGERVIKSLFAPLPVAPIGLYNNFLIPHFAKDTESQRQPILVKPRLGFYNGLQPAPAPWYMKDTVFGATGTTTLFNTYPAFSSFDRFPYNQDALDLNWTNPPQFYQQGIGASEALLFPDFDGRTANSAYTNYWQKWFDNTYDPYSRVMEATFSLTTKDVRELNFNDFIFIKDSWWQPIEVKDYTLGQQQNISVKLVKWSGIGVTLNDTINGGLTYFAYKGLCYHPTSANFAACCTDPNRFGVWTTTSALELATVWFNNGQGTSFSNLGYYSDGYYVYNIGDYGAVLDKTLVSSYSCVIFGLTQYTAVAESKTGCGSCCATSRPLTVWGDGATFNSSVNLYADNLGTPLEPNRFYGRAGNNTLQVGIDGHTVTLGVNCVACGCDNYTNNGPYALGYTFDSACCVQGVTGSDGIFTMYQDQTTLSASSYFYYDPSKTLPVPDPIGFTGGTGYVTGSTGWISDGNISRYVIGGTAATSVTCDFTTNPCFNRTSNVNFRTTNNALPFTVTVLYEPQISYNNLSWFGNGSSSYSGTSTVTFTKKYVPLTSYIRVKFTSSTSNRVQLVVYRNGIAISTTYYDTPGPATTYYTPSFVNDGAYDFYFNYSNPEI